MAFIDLLPSDARLRSLPPGELIFAQGDPGDMMYVVAEGEVNVMLDGKVVEVIQSDGIVGEMALIDIAPRSATAVTRTRCILIPVDDRLFRELISRRPDFAIHVMRVLARRLRRMDSPR